MVRCGNCGTENPDGSRFCMSCRAPLDVGAMPGEGAVPAGEVPEAGAEPSREGPPGEMVVKPTKLAIALSILWDRKGPILIALFVVLMMSMVFAPWAFIRVDVLGISIVSRQFNGWEIFIPRVLFFLAIVPLVISMFLIAGIGTRRRVIETHICTFFAGIMFTIWLIIFALSQVLRSVLSKAQVIYVNPAGGQVATIFLLLGFLLGIIITSYDRGRRLSEAGMGG